MPIPVVYDVNVLVDAAPAPGGDPFSWPSLPPRTNNPPRDALGAINDRRDFALWLSPHILDNTHRVLRESYGYDDAEAGRYVDILVEMANGSGGGVMDPPRTVHANIDHEDNLVLDLAAATDAMLLVSKDKHMLDMRVWRGTPLIHPRDFASRADAAWRGRPKSELESTTDIMKRRIEKVTAAKVNGHAADAIAVPTAPDSYRQLRAEFDANHARATEIVDGWNPHNAALRPRIELWNKALPGFANQASQADALVATQPDAAESVLVTINTKLDYALDRMDPGRAAKTNGQPAAAKRLTRPVFDDTPAVSDDRQFGS